MSGQKWPLGSEVKRKDLTGGVMLYDASRAGNANPSWFEPAYWRERNELEGEARGRGTTHFIRSGKQNFVLRHYRRGGHMAAVMRDRYLWRGEAATRGFAEWHLLYHLHRAGLPVPAPIAVRYQRHGALYTADIITERLLDSVTLADQLRRRGIPILGWITLGRCIRTFHNLGVCHPDLNAHNILLVGDDSVCLIDFDRGQLKRPGLWCDENLVRLRRSLEKITYRLPPEHFSEADWHGLLDGYREVGGMPGAARPAAASGTPASNKPLKNASDFDAAVAAAMAPASASAPTPASAPARAAEANTPPGPGASRATGGAGVAGTGGAEGAASRAAAKDLTSAPQSAPST